MRHFLLLVSFTFLTLPIFGQKQLNEIDLRVRGIGSGTSYSAVLRKLGKPLRSTKKKYTAKLACSGAAETHLTLLYSGLGITLLGDGRERNFEVYSIEITSGKWPTSGVSIGADPSDVLTKFGKPNSKQEKSGETVFYYVTKDNIGGVNFYFRRNKLAKILMTETLC